MNNLFAPALFLTCSAALFIGCETATPVEASGTPDNQTFYGSVIDTDGTMNGADMRAALDKSGRAEVRFEGEITATCAKKGCWMDVASGEDTVFVRFLDTGFCPHGRRGRQAHRRSRLGLQRHLDGSYAEAQSRGRW